MADFLMPALGADMETGKVVQWLVRSGERVRPGDVVAVVETHKGAIDVEIFLDGVIEDLAPLDTELKVGAVLARVRTAGDAAVPATPRETAVPAAPREAAVPAAPRETAVPATPRETAVPAAPREAAVPATPREGAVPAHAAAPDARPKVSPAARQRALALGIDANAVHGSGPEGAVTVADVERAASGTPSPAASAVASRPARTHGFDPAQMRLAIAAAMARSKREIPHYYLGETIPMQRALDWLRERNAALPVTERLLPAVLLLKAVALALQNVPELNGLFVGGAFRAAAAVHIGVAIWMRGGGLVAPALHDVQDKPLAALMAELADLVKRARAGGIRSSEMTDPTITVTNLGDTGSEAVFGVIYPPQVALVGFGRIGERPWVQDGRLVAAPVVQASLAADHRTSDGHRGALFLAELAERLQRPDSL
jgi:pyruvate dehydrogenase E2 component (dihydrolipoamide acetyltransferase)